VGDIAGRLAQKICRRSRKWGKTKEEIANFYNSLGQYHDIGKYAIPFEILEKQGKLTDEETRLVRIHPEMGEQMLKEDDNFKRMLPAVRHHHERWDGTGYPDGLQGFDIPLEARIIAIADTFDAIVSDRPYRKGSTPRKAVEEILRCSGTQFDPHLTWLFWSMMRDSMDVAI